MSTSVIKIRGGFFRTFFFFLIFFFASNFFFLYFIFFKFFFQNFSTFFFFFKTFQLFSLSTYDTKEQQAGGRRMTDREREKHVIQRWTKQKEKRKNDGKIKRREFSLHGNANGHLLRTRAADRFDKFIHFFVD